MRTFIFFIFGILFLSFASNAQKHYLSEIDSLNKELAYVNDTLKVKVLDQLVRKYFSVNENAKMYSSLNELERLSHALSSYEGQFKANFYQGMIAFNIEWQPSKALRHLHRALKIGEKYKINDPKTYSSIYNNLGLIYKNLEQFDSAAYCYQKVIQINENNGLAKNNVVIYLNMARMHHAIGNIVLTLKYAKKCLDLAVKEGDDLSQFIGHKTMAEFLVYIRSLDVARDYAKRARSLCLSIYGKDHSNMAAVSSILSKIEFYSGNHENALLYAKQGEKILVKIYGNIHPKLAGTFIVIGHNYSELNQYDSAKYYYQKAFKCTNSIQEENNLTRLMALQALAKCYASTNDHKNAIKYFNLALNVKGLQAEARSTGYSDMAKYFFKKGEFTKSLKAYQQAININLSLPLDTEYKDPPVELLSTSYRGLLLMQWKAEVHEHLYSQSKEREYLIKAATEYQICDSIINTFRNNYQNTKDLLNYNQSVVKVYNGGVRVSQKLYDMSGDRKYKQMAFLFAEKEKANLLYRSISLQNALRYSFLPDSVLAYEETLKGQITFCLSRINANRNDDSIRQNYEERLLTLERNHEKFLREIEDLFPRYYKLKYGNEFLPLHEIQKKLAENVVVEYVLTEESIYIFLIRSNNSQIIKLERPGDLDQRIEDMRLSILSKQYQEYNDVAHSLYKILFEPLEPYLNKEDHIVIVPDGKLWYLNFDLLLKSEGTGKPFYALDYLINDYTISYANSANHLFINDDLPTITRSSNKCLAFSYSSDSAATSSMDFLVLRDFTHDLPGTREEIRSISKLFPGKYYFGSLASEANFKR
ncbi:tetratricopeptide repeat protein, partial [Fulvivirga kasyanovii]|nr:tetratricopeptide repeat protein [Fulvivirga kasyanovii]